MTEQNRTENRENSTHYDDIITALFIGVLIIVGIITNGIVCYVYAKLLRSRSMIKRPFQSFILTMSSMDLLCCLVGFPLDMVVLTAREVPNTRVLCSITSFIIGLGMTSDSFMLLAINTIRYYSVVYPLKTTPRRCIYLLPALTLMVSCIMTLPFAIDVDLKKVNISEGYFLFECQRSGKIIGTDIAVHATFVILVLFCLIWQVIMLARKLDSMKGDTAFLAKIRPPVSGISNLSSNTETPSPSCVESTEVQAHGEWDPGTTDDFSEVPVLRTRSVDSMGSSTDDLSVRYRQTQGSPSRPAGSGQPTTLAVPGSSQDVTMKVEEPSKRVAAATGGSSHSSVRRKSSNDSIGSSTDQTSRRFRQKGRLLSSPFANRQLMSLAVPKVKENMAPEESGCSRQSQSWVPANASETPAPEKSTGALKSPSPAPSSSKQPSRPDCKTPSTKKDSSLARIWDRRKSSMGYFLHVWQARAATTRSEPSPEHVTASPSAIAHSRWWRLRKMVTTRDQTLLTMCVATGLFALLYLPHVVVIALHASHVWEFPSSRLGVSAKGVVNRSFYILTAANAIIYNHFNRGFRGKVKSLFRRINERICCQRRN